MRISDWSSDVCSSDLKFLLLPTALVETDESRLVPSGIFAQAADCNHRVEHGHVGAERDRGRFLGRADDPHRSEEHTSELQSLMRISYAVFCLKKKTTITLPQNTTNDQISVQNQT